MVHGTCIFKVVVGANVANRNSNPVDMLSFWTTSTVHEFCVLVFLFTLPIHTS